METYIYSHMHVAEKTVIFGDVDSGLPASMFTSSLKKTRILDTKLALSFSMHRSVACDQIVMSQLKQILYHWKEFATAKIRGPFGDNFS